MPDLISDDQHETILATAHAAADAARAAILPHFRTALKADNKLAEGFDPVTIADRQAEQAMRDVIRAARPDDAILGEEFGLTEGRSGLTWVLDPIDGTRGFISGTPTWGVLIGLRDASAVRLGVIDQPYIGERFLGGFGRAEMTGPQGRAPLRTSICTALDQATIFTTFPEVGTKVEAAAFARVAVKCRLTRYGMDCYAYALLAAGQVELVIEAGLHSYDINGPIGVIEAAGGIVTNWQGGPALDGGQVIAAANATIHQAAMALLAEAAA